MSEQVLDWRGVACAAGPYAERADEDEGRVDRFLLERGAQLSGWLLRQRRRHHRIVDAVEALGPALANLSESDLRARADALRAQLSRGASGFAQIADAFALIREAATRTLGMRHFPVQLIGGWTILNGRVAEMNTGEGKTLTATLPAATAALCGLPVHVVTVNDYLAQRDADSMRPVYALLGLSVGVVQHGQTPPERSAAYQADIAYCTNKELAFDYLRDRIVLGGHVGRGRLELERLFGSGDRIARLLLRGLYFAIVDEVDSVLIDEARTPLIISAGDDAADEAGPHAAALEIARALTVQSDFALDQAARQVRLTERGRERLALLGRELPGAWRSQRGREELATQALSALHMFERDKHYIVADGRVQIVDEFTGRVMADRRWERGLQQLIELKEGCEPSGRRVTQARVTYQRFFRRYLLLGGMSGTAAEVAPELWSVYRLKVTRVPTNRPVRRADRGSRMLRDAAARWAAVVAAVAREHQAGRPVLIGTRSVAASEQLSARLTDAAIDHRVLNARFDSEEAAIVAEAGMPGAVTVATNMAGRGTDILLGPGVAAAGGLHVILTEYHESARIDRPLFGRCARQGDLGSCEAIVALDDDLFAQHAPRLCATLRVSSEQAEIAAAPAALLRRVAQSAAERAGVRVRRATFDADRQLDQTLGFAGGIK